MRLQNRFAVRLKLATLALILLGACVQSVWTTRPRKVALDGSPQTIQSPLKAHLADGGTIVYAQGASISAGKLIGNGKAYRLLDDVNFTMRGEVPLDSVVGIETFEGKLLAAPTVALSL